MTVPVKASIPAELLETIPPPDVPDYKTMTDIEIGVFILEDGKIIEALNGKLESIAELVN